MPTSRPSEHQNEILDQFTRQATPFATAPGIRDEAALKLIGVSIAKAQRQAKAEQVNKAPRFFQTA